MAPSRSRLTDPATISPDRPPIHGAERQINVGYPPAPVRPAPLAVAPAAGHDQDLMSKRVLIVDDHRGFRRSASRALGAEGWTVVGEASDGASGLREAERCEPDVVLVDVGLPDVSGIEVTRRLHERVPGLALVVI